MITILLGACNRDIEEFRFTGKVVGAGLCAQQYVIPYIIEIYTPDSIGDSVTLSNGTYYNAVIAYRSPQLLKQYEEVQGVAYMTRDYGALNCGFVFEDELPEMIILDVEPLDTVK